MESGPGRDQTAMNARRNGPVSEASARDAVEVPASSAGERAADNRPEMKSRAKPHIVLLHYSAPPVVGGVERVIGEQARLFLDNGNAVTVVAGRAAAEGIAHGAQVVVVPELDTENESNRKVMEALDAGMVLPGFREMQTRIEEALRPVCLGDVLLIAHNVLNLHLNMPLTAALHHLLDEGTLQRVIAWCHDVSPYANPKPGAPLRFGFPWDLLRTCRPEVKYVAVSRQRQRVLSHILECPPEQIRVIPDGIDPEAFAGLGDVVSCLVKEFELLQADLILLMPVRVTRAKKIKRAIEIIACLREMGIQVKLIVTGPPGPHALDGKAYFNELVALRRKLNLKREVCFLWEGLRGRPGPLTVEPSVVAELYRICDLVLLTSDCEGFGLPVLEAGLAGRTIFTTEAPVVEDLELGSVFGITRGELATQVARRILEWTEQDIPQRLRRQVRRDYSWSAIFQRHIEPLLRECTVPSQVQA